MKKKTVTSETEEITIDNKKQKRKREKKRRRRLHPDFAPRRWMRWWGSSIL